MNKEMKDSILREELSLWTKELFGLRTGLIFKYIHMWGE